MRYLFRKLLKDAGFLSPLVFIVIFLFSLLGFSSILIADFKSESRVKIKGDSVASNYKKPSEEELRKKLTPEQFKVTQHEGTEAPFNNAYWDNERPGIYVDIVSGEPLFSSIDKYDSGTGWPSFSKPIDSVELALKKDTRIPFQTRTEVRSSSGDSHLGHLFKDGPSPTGDRYCINSASLRFVPVEDLESEGYGRYLSLFKNVLDSQAMKKVSQTALESTQEVAILAGGCFWGMQDIIRKIPGVISTRVGYTGGGIAAPTYELVKTGSSGHAEAIEILFDRSKITYSAILEYFFRMHDPTTLNRQGNDIGTQYRSAIFITSDEQEVTAKEVITKVNTQGKWAVPVVTTIERASQFFEAEDYHQDYLEKNPGGYTCHFLRE